MTSEETRDAARGCGCICCQLVDAIANDTTAAELRQEIEFVKAERGEQERRLAADVADAFVAHALIGAEWETRDSDNRPPCWVERGVGVDCERFIEAPLSYGEACKIERLLEVARALPRAVALAEGMLQMIDRDTWRATGGDDGQGHYEGDYRAEQVEAEIASMKELVS